MRKYYFLLIIVLFQMNGFANPKSAIENPTFSVTVDCATLALTTSASTASQTPCINTAIVDISYVFGNGATSATVSGLPSGVTSTIVGNTITLSGTPNEAGSFNYAVSTVGGACSSILNGIIDVYPIATVILASASSTASQAVCINQPINTIVYSIGGSAVGATVTGLPSGITGSFAGGNFTISGAPNAAGTFIYTVTTLGVCSATTLSGSIAVSPNANLLLTSAAGTTNQTVCVNTPIMNITYTISNGATGATVTGFPSGIVAAFNTASNTMTISGSPTQTGIFDYMVTTTGGCGTAFIGGTITVQSPLNPPAVISPLFYCQNLIAPPLTAIGSNLLWYNTAVGGIGTTVAPTPQTFLPGITTYYVSQSAGSCEGQRATIVVTVNAAPVLNLSCDAVNSTSTNLAFDWSNVPGATGYNYSYTIGNGPAVYGTITSASNFFVPGVSAGQSVTFEISSVNGVACSEPQTVTCLFMPLATEQFESAHVSLYPNPMHGKLMIETAAVLKKAVVYNLVGQDILEKHLTGSKAEIDLSDVQKGTYLVQIISDSWVKTFRIVKN